MVVPSPRRTRAKHGPAAVLKTANPAIILILFAFTAGAFLASTVWVPTCPPPLPSPLLPVANETAIIHQAMQEVPPTALKGSPPSHKSKNNIHIQAAVTTSTQGLEFAMRLWVTSLNGWHQDFQADDLEVPIYTFDAVADQSPLRKIVTPLQPLFPDEPTRKNNNLLLAAIPQVYALNPNADWYLLAEDDSIIVRENLEHAILTLKLDPNEESIHGKCAGTPGATNGAGIDVPFAIGGAGILISRALMKALVPYIDECRRKFIQMRYGDERIGACLKVVMDRTLDWCGMDNHYPFVHLDILTAVDKFADAESLNTLRIASLHEKNPKRIQLLQEWIQSRSGGDQITYRGLKEDGTLIAALKAAENA